MVHADVREAADDVRGLQKEAASAGNSDISESARDVVKKLEAASVLLRNSCAAFSRAAEVSVSKHLPEF